MFYQTVTEIVRKTDAAAVASIFSLAPTHQEDVPVHGFPNLKVRPGKRGIILHEALAESLEGRWVDHSVWPICAAARGWLREQGVDCILTEVPLGTSGVRGVCDALASGGPSRQGIIEWKTCSNLPDTVLPEAVFQIGLYANLVQSPENTWGAIGYICVQKRRIRIYYWASLGDCAIAAKRFAA
jgi:hypothetical protein